MEALLILTNLPDEATVREFAVRRVESRLAACEHHPHELPEIIAVPVTPDLPGCLAWIATETTPRSADTPSC